MLRNTKISGTGIYLPKKRMTAEDMDKKLNVSQGWVRKKTEVLQRYFVEEETASQMGALAAQAALADAQLTLADIDCLISTSGTVEQAIPCTASLIQKQLKMEHSGIPAFDINSTCLSFLVGLDVVSYMLTAGRYNYVLLVSSEVASVGLDWNDKESASLFGDGAAAVIVSRANSTERSHIISSRMETYSSGAELSQIRGGGTKVHPRTTREIQPFLFEMNGPALFKLSARKLPKFINSLLDEATLTMNEIDLVIPHQASALAMKLVAKKLNIPMEKMMYILPDHGNTIAASIPMALHYAIKTNRIQRGSRILLLGTSAGLSIGGMILEY